MSTFSGKQHKGAMKLHRMNKREQAEQRNKVSNAQWFDCGHIHGTNSPGVCNDPSAIKFLQEIFTGKAWGELQ